MLLVEIHSAGQTARPPSDRNRPRHSVRSPAARWFRPAIFAGAAAGLAAVLVMILLPGVTARQPRPGPRTSGTTALTAAYILDRAASAAASAPQPVPRPDQFIYYSFVSTDTGFEDGEAWLTRVSGHVWVSVSGQRAGIAHDTQQANEKLPWGPVPPPISGGQSRWTILPALSCPGSAPSRGTYAFLTSLSADPALLRTWIYRHLDGQNPPDQQAWIDIGDMLRYTLAPPTVAAALFRVAATIPGAMVVPHAANAIGRSGVAVSRSGAELIFDPRTYQLIGERAVLTRPVAGEGPAGTVTESTARLQVTVVSGLPDVPPSQVGKPEGGPTC